MDPKLRVVLEKLARRDPKETLRLLLRFESGSGSAALDDDWYYCCGEHPEKHANDCEVDQLLKELGLPDRDTRNSMLLLLRRTKNEITITQPVGNCDGNGLYAYDTTKEDGRGEFLSAPCPGCRACR